MQSQTRAALLFYPEGDAISRLSRLWSNSTGSYQVLGCSCFLETWYLCWKEGRPSPCAAHLSSALLVYDGFPLRVFGTWWQWPFFRIASLVIPGRRFVFSHHQLRGARSLQSHAFLSGTIARSRYARLAEVLSG